jgi:hypothetical protein
MKSPVVVVGIGELGSVFARGFLKTGHPVYPITRHMSMLDESKQIPEPEAVLIAVGETDLHPTLEALPEAWKDRVILLQNELLPRDWQAHAIDNPTVISVWFEKKKGMDSKVVLPSPVYGPHAQLMRDALASLDIPSYEVDDMEALEYELVRKNLYILTTNIAGLELPDGATVDELRHDHPDLMDAVAHDVMDIQAWLVGHELDRPALMAGMLDAFDGDPAHKCKGRSAPARLRRALLHADEAGLEVPTLREIARKHLD